MGFYKSDLKLKQRRKLTELKNEQFSLLYSSDRCESLKDTVIDCANKVIVYRVILYADSLLIVHVVQRSICI